MKDGLVALFIYAMGFGAVLFIERWGDHSYHPTPWGLAVRRALLWPLYLFAGIPHR